MDTLYQINFQISTTSNAFLLFKLRTQKTPPIPRRGSMFKLYIPLQASHSTGHHEDIRRLPCEMP